MKGFDSKISKGNLTLRLLFHLRFVVRQKCAGQRGSRISLSYNQSTSLKNLSYDKNA